jgi:murein DD-endopeptidase MepM/ murein hydrolase activator NlpD
METEEEARPKQYRMVRQPKKHAAFETRESEAMEDEAFADDRERDASTEADFEDIVAEADSEESEGEQGWEYDISEDEALDAGTAPAPMPVPKRDPVPFAPVPTGVCCWPIQNASGPEREVNYRQENGGHVGRRPGRRFLAKRATGGRAHAAVDLYARFNDPVVACEDGTIVAFYPFCCGRTKTSWALLVEHAGVVVNYGEVAPDSLAKAGLKKGSQVRAGQIIASVGRNPRGSSMLHFETWAKGTAANRQWIVGRPRPAGLLNPTKYLLALQAAPASTPQTSREDYDADASHEGSDIVAFYADEDLSLESPFLSEFDDED